MQHGIAVLNLKESCGNIAHALLRIKLLGAHADSVDKMRLAATRRPIDKHGVELHGAGMLSDRQSYRAWQLVAVAFYIIGECEMRIELWVKRLRLGSIERCRALVGALGGLLLDSVGGIGPDGLGAAFVLALPIDDNAI